MPTLNIGGRKVTVDDGFLKLSPEQQNATVEEIASSLGPTKPQAAAPQLDQYQQAAIQERDAMKAQGIDTGAGMTRRAMQGATFNTADEILAGLTTPLEMIKRGTFSPREGYNYAKAREDLIMDDARKNTGMVGTAAELAGGVLTGTGLARAGATFMPAAEAGLAARSLGGAADAALMGGIAGAAEGNGLAERGGNAMQGALLGGAIGGAAPGAIGLLKAATSPITSNIAARVNPENYARNQMARALSESGRTPQQIADDLAMAAREGQGMFTAADAMGNAGQRMLSSTARAPGQGRTAVVDFLEGRQAGQGRRVSNQLADGFDSPQTAAQAEARLTAARAAEADAAYGAVRNDAQPVDLTGVINRIDETLTPGVNRFAQSNIANDSIESSLEGFRRRLTDGQSNLTDFTAIQRLRGELSDAVQTAQRGGQGNRARLLGGVLREMDTAMESASAGFRQANARFAQQSRDIEAVGQGRQAATRGRTEDILPAYQGLSPEGQAAFRTGYVDPLIQQAQGAAFGVNKARPLLNDAFAAESAAMAPGNPVLARQLARENTMFQTRNAALGNSKTAENLADDAALGVDPTLIGNLLSGNWTGAARNALQAGQNALSGNTPRVRQELARLLMSRQGSAQDFERILTDAIDSASRRRMVAAVLARGSSGALAVGPSATSDFRK